MKTPIVMTCWRRPKYLRQVLEALASCRGFGDRAVYVYLDGGGMTVPQFYECLKPVPIKQVRTFPSQMNLGCTNNSVRALDETFKATNESHVILMEEDVEPKADFLEWAEWAEVEGMPAARSAGFPVLSAAAWLRASKRSRNENVVVDAFCVWGAVIPRRSWPRLREGALTANGVPGLSWDVATTNSRAGLQLRSCECKVENIGAELGAYMPTPQRHAEYFAGVKYSDGSPNEPFRFARVQTGLRGEE